MGQMVFERRQDVIIQEDAIKALKRLVNGDDTSIADSINNAASWAQYAQEAIEREDYQCAKTCIEVIRYSLKGQRA